MKKLFSLLLLAFTPAAYCDITQTFQTSAQVQTVGASVTANRIPTSISVSGSNIIPNDGTAGGIGSLNLSSNGIANGVPVISADTNYTVSNSSNPFSLVETYIQGDNTSTTTSSITNGVSSLNLLGEYTLVSGGDVGSVTITLDAGADPTLDVSSMGAGSTATVQQTITLGID